MSDEVAKTRKGTVRTTVFILIGFLMLTVIPASRLQDGGYSLLAGESVDIWVGKGCGAHYNDGDSVDIYFKVNSSASSAVIAVYHYFPAGSPETWIKEMLVSTNETYRLTRKAACPEGLHNISITAVMTGGTSVTLTDECKFYVENCKTYDNDYDGYISILSGGDDCDDYDPDVHPGAEEVCDGKDNDCDKLIDEGLDCNFAEIWVDKQCGANYTDGEAVNIHFTVYSAAPTAQVTLTDYLPQGGYKNLFENKTFTTNEQHSITKTVSCPAGVETLVVIAVVVTDGTSQTFTAECIIHVTGCQVLDEDGDGHNSVLSGGDDCDDSDPAVYPGAEEISDGKDNDCNGQIDETATMGQIDDDQDGYPLSVDCNDRDASVNPFAAELCDDGKDNDCDGFTDCSDIDCAEDDACKQGFSLPGIDLSSFNLSNITSLVTTYKYYLAGVAAGIVAVIFIVLLLKRRKRGGLEEEVIPPVLDTMEREIPPRKTESPPRRTEEKRTSVREPEEEPPFAEISEVEDQAGFFDEMEESEQPEQPEESEETLDIEGDLFG
jgi:hypothetical protein